MRVISIGGDARQVNAVQSMGSGLGPALFNELFEHALEAGHPRLIWWCGAALVLASLLLACWVPNLRRRRPGATPAADTDTELRLIRAQRSTDDDRGGGGGLHQWLNSVEPHRDQLTS
jgi:hypothetical protein